jgi:hypothetical protein
MIGKSFPSAFDREAANMYRTKNPMRRRIVATVDREASSGFFSAIPFRPPNSRPYKVFGNRASSAA